MNQSLERGMFQIGVRLGQIVIDSATIPRHFEGHAAAVTAVAFCPNGKQALSTDDAGVTFLWKLP